MTTRLSRLRGLPATAILLLAASAPLWAILVTQVWVPVPDRVLRLVIPAAVTLVVIAAIFWAAGSSRKRERQMQERERALIRVIDSLDAERPSQPFRVVH